MGHSQGKRTAFERRPRAIGINPTASRCSGTNHVASNNVRFLHKMSVFVIGAIQLACCELKNGQYGQKTDNFRAKMVRSINLTPDLGQTNINWSIKNQIKDSLPIMELHKTDLFCPLVAEFEVPDHFWSEKDAMTSSVKIFEIWFFRCIYSLAKGPGLCHIDGL